MTIIAIWIVGALIVIGFLVLFYNIVKSSVLSSEKRKKIVNEFIQKNKHLPLKVINSNFHKMYRSLDGKTRRQFPVDVMWQSVMRELEKD